MFNPGYLPLHFYPDSCKTQFILCLLRSASPAEPCQPMATPFTGSPNPETLGHLRRLCKFSLRRTLVPKARLSPLLLSQFWSSSSLTGKTRVPAWVHMLLLRTLNCWTECSKIKHVHIMPLLNPAVASVQGRVWPKQPSFAPPCLIARHL